MALDDRRLDRAFRALTDSPRRWIVEDLLGRQRICSIEPEALFAAERWLRSVMWARYGKRIGSLPEDYPGLRALLRS